MTYTADQIAQAINNEAIAWASFFAIDATDESLEGRKQVMRANVASGYLAPLFEFLPINSRSYTLYQVENYKSRGRYSHAGALACFLGAGDGYGCHYGMRSDRQAAIDEYKRGYQDCMDAINAN
jgi:hypothetical protein